MRRGAGLDISDAVIAGRLVRSVTISAALVEFYDNEIPPGGKEVSASHGVGSHEHVYVLAGAVLAGPVDAPVELAPRRLRRLPGRPAAHLGVRRQGARARVDHAGHARDRVA